MARRKVADPVGIASWEEADRLLGQIAERRREEERIRLELEIVSSHSLRSMLRKATKAAGCSVVSSILSTN